MEEKQLMGNLLDSWLKIEFLTGNNTIDFKKKEIKSLNKETWASYIKLQRGREKNIIIYSGAFFESEKYKELAKIFNDNGFREVSSALTYCLEIKLTPAFELVDKIKVSSVPWAIGCLKSNSSRIQWARAFSEFEEIINSKGQELFTAGNSALESCEKLLNLYFEKSRWKPPLINNAVHYFRPISEKSEESNGQMLNSFYASDINKILNDLSKGQSVGKALKDYLKQEPDVVPIDLLQNHKEVKRILKPENLSKGCWPSDYSLSLMQQVAVNLISEKLFNKEGIFSVNGPPGTGKTTLLKDVFAAIIARRASEMIKFAHPEDAFKREEKIFIKEKFEPYYYSPSQAILQDAIVVASSNNTAVENITKELPEIKSIQTTECSSLQYFKELSDYYFNMNNSSQQMLDTWGLFALPLGKAENLSLVVKAWYGENNPGKSFGNELTSFEKEVKKGIKKTLQENSFSINDWEEARKNYKTAEKKYAEKIEEIKEYQLFLEDPELEGLCKDTPLDLELNYEYLSQRLKEVINEIYNCTRISREINDDILLRLNLKPPFWAFWFNLKSAKEFKGELQQLSNKRETNRQQIENLSYIKSDIERKQSKIVKLIELRKRYSRSGGGKEELNFLPDSFFWKNAFENYPAISQQLSPWMDARLKQASIDLFTTSIKVHEIFVSLASKPITNNLSILVALMSKSITYIEPQALSKVWNTFFLVVPVVSTTFASIGTMFRDLKKESLGWLFVDEAGQAVPQAAVGAIWRSKRAVFVGDPIQIEPVVSLPEKVYEYFRVEGKLEPAYLSSVNSVQTIADKGNSHGGWIGRNEERRWVGCPLKVHRRCVNPMFQIANRIAYDNLMLNATSKKQNLFGVGESRFVSVKGISADGQWVKEQGDEAIKIIKGYLNNNKGKEISLYVITPFTAVVKNFRSMAKTIFPDYEDIWQRNIGTVHTFQGKEADVVIFLMGCDSSQQGAANWASSKPNLLNVALTRAKYVFIAIGDKDIWGSKNHFQEMIRTLECR